MAREQILTVIRTMPKLIVTITMTRYLAGPIPPIVPWSTDRNGQRINTWPLPILTEYLDTVKRLG